MLFRRIAQAVGIVIGLALAGGAIWSVFFIEWRTPLAAPEPTIRPVKTTVVAGRPTIERTFPARVRATNEVTISFQVPGTIQELPVIRGQRVAEGELLAQLDQRDFESRVASARAQSTQLAEEFGAVSRAAERGAATPIEVIRFRAAAERAESELEIAEKALEDTTLTAPFAGVVADLFVDRFQKVSVGTRVLRLHGSDPVRVEINVDAARVALNRTFEGAVEHSVRFDFLPDRRYAARLVEFTTEADRTTQTFLAIFEIDMPADVVVLPGMSATLAERFTGEKPGTSRDVAVPIESVSLDGAGTAFVWVVGATAADGTATVQRRDVELGEAVADAIVIRQGLAPGEQIVVAGARELEEGRRVRPGAASLPARTTPGRP
ncbi:MAG TPA: efflux RND transporter periplasmic adaptor subunit [Phycisphaerales bacterium]|nr:efflux RND transporter periplasmic adaptor subunit [Phycisphaerales bacterium]HMP35852.1 efflux RND transporter periplasmic adaptor subunit [Phycisphaerales bacterium]